MKQLAILLFAPLISFAANANEVQYNLKIDGITCQTCINRSEAALKGIDGVKAVKGDVEKGTVIVCAEKKVMFTDKQLTALFSTNGFTYRSMAKQEQCDPA